VISIDPSRRKSGGALLGDRIRMNAINHPNIFMRSLATREAGSEISQALPDVIAACKAARFDLVIVETSGIGQGDAAIVPHVDLSLYVMTPEFGAASQLEKIDMLDFADFVAINKFDRKGAQDALRDVAKQVQRNREQWHSRAEDMPVFGTQASRFNDDGVTALYQGLVPALARVGWPEAGHTAESGRPHFDRPECDRAARAQPLSGRDGRHGARLPSPRGAQSRLARERQQLRAARHAAGRGHERSRARARWPANATLAWRGERKLLAMWPQMQAAYAATSTW
jgi:methylmalonyl-CoA mutase